MNKKILALPIVVLALSSCKTTELHKRNHYNSPVFDENYYLEWAGFDSEHTKEIKTPTVENNPDHSSFSNYCYEKKLAKVDEKFEQGILGKLYDGRTICDGYYQLSRVQVDKSGFAIKFPLKLKTANKFEFASRGGSTLRIPYGGFLNYDFDISFYIPDGEQYKEICYSITNQDVHTDHSSQTNLISFSTDGAINGAVGMSMKFKCNNLPDGLTDDYQDKEKDHLALMLYEVLLPDSTWIK